MVFSESVSRIPHSLDSDGPQVAGTGAEGCSRRSNILWRRIKMRPGAHGSLPDASKRGLGTTGKIRARQINEEGGRGPRLLNPPLIPRSEPPSSAAPEGLQRKREKVFM